MSTQRFQHRPDIDGRMPSAPQIPEIPTELRPEAEDVVEARHTIDPVVDSLPGESVPYALNAGEGQQFDVGPLHLTLMSRPLDNNGAFSLVRAASGPFSRTPVMALDGALFIHLLEGELLLQMPSGTSRILPGASATVPAGVPWAVEARGMINSALVYTASAAPVRLAEEFGHPSPSHTFGAATHSAPDAADVVAAGILSVPEEGIVLPETTAPDADGLPEQVEAFSVPSGGGERGEQFEQINGFLCRPRHTGNRFFAIDTRGARAPYIPRHFHRMHTENFLCLEGKIGLHVNGKEMVLTHGDYVHAPAGTIHSFAFLGHNTRMLGLLTTGVFEPFFDLMNTPTERRIQLEDGSAPWFPERAFSRVQADLDVEVVGPPPQ